ncbi:MAG: TRAP transporter large permease [Candidatus Atribacteria bacterium]|nr:TRAP transporter large permease [Candidatus Atribacteria bacterium]
MSGLVLIGLIFILAFMGIPVVFALGGAEVMGIYLIKANPFRVMAQSMYMGINYFPLLAIPLYICMGELMSKADLTKRLIRFSSLFVGRVPGGLAHINILVSMFFAGMNGSAVADSSSVGGILIPAMIKEGYSKDISVAVTASSSCIGPIIPPSIIMVVYGATVGVSIGSLFVGGIIPGILLGLALMGIVLIMAPIYNFPRITKPIKWPEKWIIIREAAWPLGMPIIIVGGILGGVFTPTEAGAIGLLYCIIVGLFIIKSLKIKDLFPIFYHTALVTSTVLLIIGMSRGISWILSVLQFQNFLTQALMQISTNPVVFLLLVNILLLILGTFMDASASIIIFAPILTAIAVNYGINPLHFGLIMVLNLTIGHITPPLGLCLMVTSEIADISLERGAKAVFPFLLSEIGVLMIITYVPQIVLYIPKLLGYI